MRKKAELTVQKQLKEKYINSKQKNNKNNNMNGVF